MHVISVINYKGGVGKTTVTANLGAGLARLGKKVLLIDVDPQTSLTFSFVNPDEWHEQIEPTKTLKTWHEAFDSTEAVSLASLAFAPKAATNALQGRGKLDLISSHLHLINLDLELATELGGASQKASRAKYMKVHRRLARELEAIAPDTYDYVLIDCPPNFNILTKNAIIASHSVLVPARPDYLSTLGISYLMRNLNELEKDFNEQAGQEGAENVLPIHPGLLGVLFTMVNHYAGNPIATQAKYINQEKARADAVPVFDNVVRYSPAGFAEAPENCLPMILASHPTKPAEEAHESLLQVVAEFLTHTTL